MTTETQNGQEILQSVLHISGAAFSLALHKSLGGHRKITDKLTHSIITNYIFIISFIE